MKLGVLGRGRAASALVPRWVAAGHSLVYQVSARDVAAGLDLGALPTTEVVVFATPDRTLTEVAAALGARAGAASETWIHLSGSVGAEVLRQGKGVPFAVAAMHPLVAFGAALQDATGESGGAAGLGPLGAVAGIDGEPAALAIAEVLATAAGLRPIAIASAHKALYHAAAVTVAGHATALFAQAMEMLAAVGFGPEDARAALQPLFMSAASNLGARHPAAALTGPEVRGDATTLARHVAAFAAAGARLGPRTIATYRRLSEEAVGLAEDRLDPEQIRELLAVLATLP